MVPTFFLLRVDSHENVVDKLTASLRYEIANLKPALITAMV